MIYQVAQNLVDLLQEGLWFLNYKGSSIFKSNLKKNSANFPGTVDSQK